jgi:hypothetical protein
MGNADFVSSAKGVGDRMVLTTYGRSSGFCVDPIKKKPLNYFFTLSVLQAPVP